MDQSKNMLLCKVNSEEELNITLSLLASHGITTDVKRRGSGSYLHIVHGMNYQGAEIYVLESEFERATDIIEASPIEEEDVELDMDFEDNQQAYQIRRRKFALVPLVFLGVFIVVASVMGLVSLIA